MAGVKLTKMTKEFEEFLTKVAAENKGTLTDMGSNWDLTASPKLVLRRKTLDEFYKGRPMWERNALWDSSPIFTEGTIAKLAEDECIIED